jgi:hypothetical protein
VAGGSGNFLKGVVMPKTREPLTIRQVAMVTNSVTNLKTIIACLLTSGQDETLVSQLKSITETIADVVEKSFPHPREFYSPDNIDASIDPATSMRYLLAVLKKGTELLENELAK